MSEIICFPTAPRRRRHGRLSRLLILLACVTTVLAGMATLGVTQAAASSSYWGVLASGEVDVTANGPLAAGAVPAGGDLSWTAPSGEQFGAFQYTNATWYSGTNDAVGGIAAGFVGSGGDAPGNLMFPYLDDCTILGANHHWAGDQMDGAPAGSDGVNSCSGGGDAADDQPGAAGGTYFNVEVESSNPSVNPEADVDTLQLETWCQAASCSSSDYAGAYVRNLTAAIIDPNTYPSTSASFPSVNGSDWYETQNGNSPTLNISSSDPGGVCYLEPVLWGAGTVWGGDQVGAPAMTNLGGNIGTVFTSDTPCETSANVNYQLPANMASGGYNVRLDASNAGNWEAGADSESTAADVNNDATSIQVDDTTPTISVAPTGSGNTGTVSVTVGPSGIGSLSCIQGGANVTLTPVAGNPGSGAGTYSYNVNTDTSALACAATNGDVNGALSTSINTPTITINPGGYTQGAWSSQPVTITPQVTQVGNDGTTGLTCTINGSSVSSPSSFAVSEDGVNTVDCSVEDASNTSLVGSASFQVSIDNQVPLVTFDTGGGNAATSTQSADPGGSSGQNWIGGTNPITIGVTATESTVLSGVTQTTCVVNGYTSGQQVLTNTAATPFDDAFTLTRTDGGINGQNAIVCSSLSGANVPGADGSTTGSTRAEYVDVNDSSWPTTPGGAADNGPGTCGISAVIDNGGCAYSDGPSQTAWTTTAQTVKITADDTGSGAPITSITCSGVSMPVSSWTASADPQDVDSDNGMTVIATVEPQGGLLSCSASDSATPADTYQLGTYEFPIDSLPPTGYFEPTGYDDAARDVIQLKATDSGSGVASVTVEAVDQHTGQVYAGSALTGDPADGSIAYATYNPGSGLYALTVDPALLPVGDSFAFTATATDVAGNTATITNLSSAAGGGPFVLAPGGSNSALGDLTTITASATATSSKANDTHTIKQSVNTTTLPELPTFAATEQTAAIRSHLAGRSSALFPLAKKKAVCEKTKTKRVKKNGKTITKKVKVKCKTTTAVTNVAALSVPYGKQVTITGTLTDTTSNATIAAATIAVYQTDLATGLSTMAGSIRTSTVGAFSYTLNAGPSREITLVYGGSANQRGTSSAFKAGYIGKTQIHTKTKVISTGKTLELIGKVLGGDVPTSGALLELYYTLPGPHNKWSQFKPGRTNRKGAFKIKIPIQKTDAGLTYELRVTVPSQIGWGYQATTSNVAKVRVK